MAALAPTQASAPPAEYTGTEPWTTGIFECWKDLNSATMTYMFPCVTYGQIAETLDGGTESCESAGCVYAVASAMFVPWMLSYQYRAKLRRRFNITQDPAPDCLTHFFCECHALAQEFRELKLRGFDPTIRSSGRRRMQAPAAQVMD